MIQPQTSGESERPNHGPAEPGADQTERDELHHDCVAETPDEDLRPLDPDGKD